MFRDNKTEMNPKVVGVGSIISAGHRKWLIFTAQGRSAHVGAMCLKTFVMVGEFVPVADVNYLSVTEARNLVDELNMNFTFTDFDFDAKGLKEF